MASRPSECISMRWQSPGHVISKWARARRIMILHVEGPGSRLEMGHISFQKRPARLTRRGTRHLVLSPMLRNMQLSPRRGYPLIGRIGRTTIQLTNEIDVGSRKTFGLNDDEDSSVSFTDPKQLSPTSYATPPPAGSEQRLQRFFTGGLWSLLSITPALSLWSSTASESQITSSFKSYSSFAPSKTQPGTSRLVLRCAM